MKIVIKKKKFNFWHYVKTFSEVAVKIRINKLDIKELKRWQRF